MLIVGPASLLLAYHLAVGFVHASPLEQFDKELNVRTLEDGKVVTHFSFRTLLQGATPRHPATLGLSDICAVCLV
jgi:phosphatidylinositol glycan class T